MVSVTHLRGVVADYLSGTDDREAFSRRLLKLMYGIEKKADDAATVELAYELEFALAKAIAGMVSEDDFRVLLADCVNSYTSVSIAEDYRATELPIPLVDSTALPYTPAEVVRC